MNTELQRLKREKQAKEDNLGEKKVSRKPRWEVCRQGGANISPKLIKPKGEAISYTSGKKYMRSL